MKVQTPYEFLVRINKDGTIAGAHVKYLTTVTDDVTKEILSQTEGAAAPVAMAVADKGFPIADILSAIQSAALVTVDAEKAKAAASDAECTAAKAETAKANAERDTAVAALAAAQAVIASRDAADARKPGDTP